MENDEENLRNGLKVAFQEPSKALRERFYLGLSVPKLHDLVQQVLLGRPKALHAVALKGVGELANGQT